jgi:23S rRNA pseudouridine955/2504/2580 synthase/23S rRNA pseudouridine1911/1915/1917 synthase
MEIPERKGNQVIEIHEQLIHQKTKSVSHASPEIVYVSNDLVAVNKPSGWLSIPDRHDPNLVSVKTWLESKEDKVFIIHRIDKDTSGLIVFAKNAEAHKYYNTLFQNRSLEKTYYGIVTGTFNHEKGSCDQPIEEHPVVAGKMRVGRKGKPAITHYFVEEQFKGFSLMRFIIETGRTHQIRVHMQNIGHPLACDPLYGTGDFIKLSAFKKKFNLSKKDEEERPLLNRLALHAFSLSFEDQQGNAITLEAPLPKDMDACLKQMRKWAKL